MLTRLAWAAAAALATTILFLSMSRDDTDLPGNPPRLPSDEQAQLDQELAAASRASAEHGPARVELGYSNGGLWVHDSAFDPWAYDDTTEGALTRAQETRAVAAENDGVVWLSACCGGNSGAPLDVEVHPSEVGRAKGYLADSVVPLSVPSGEIWIEGNGGYGITATVRVPPGDYIARFSSVNAVELQQDRERFQLDLWPAPARAGDA